jgi:hypothetical protein
MGDAVMPMNKSQKTWQDAPPFKAERNALLLSLLV